MRGEERSWPYSDSDEPGWPYSAEEDRPSWPYPGGQEHLSWPAGGGGSTVPREPAAAPPHDDRWQTAAAMRRRVPAGRARDGTQRRSGHRAAAAGPVPRGNYEIPFGGGRTQVVPGEPAAVGQQWAAPPVAGVGEVRQLPGEGPAELLGPLRRDAGGFCNTDSIRLAERILCEADEQAAEMIREARDQAAAVRQDAEREAAQVRRQAAHQAERGLEAGRKAEEIRRQAASEAEAMREAAAREADELRADAIRLSAELGQVAAYVTSTLTMPAIPVPEPLAQPRQYVAEDFARPATAAAEPAARATARLRPQAWPGPYCIEDLDGQVRPAGGPETWEPEEAWAQETWEPEGWEPESLPADRPRAEGRTPVRLRPATWPATTGPEAWPPPAEPDDVWPAVSPEEIWPTRPAGRTTTRPATRPDRRPARPATRPARRTEKPARSRQARTMRAFAGTITALVVLALGTGAYQLATHGFTFFVFRSAGTGATDNNAIFPGIIPAPKPSPAHHHPTTGPGQHGARRTHRHVKGTAGRQSHG
jgi:vacuolar-type H+-ATPase subunit H